MSEWITQIQAAEILGVHRSVIPKMLRRGELVARGQRPSLSRDDVIALARARSERADERERRRSQPPPGLLPPDETHVWLPAPVAAALLGCSVVAVNARARRGRLPSVVSGGRRWYRLDQMELYLRARAARASRSP